MNSRWAPIPGCSRYATPSAHAGPGECSITNSIDVSACESVSARQHTRINSTPVGRSPRGAPGGIRTPDARLRTAALYPLSYGGGAIGSYRIIRRMPPRPTLFVRHGCHLCEEASVLLDDMLGADGWDAVDIETDDDLLVRYAHRIPVLAVDGTDRLELIITRPDLEAVLADDPGGSATAALEPAVADRIVILAVLLGVLAMIPLLAASLTDAPAHLSASLRPSWRDRTSTVEPGRWPMRTGAWCGSTSGPPAASRAGPRCRPCSASRRPIPMSSSSWVSTGGRGPTPSPTSSIDTASTTRSARPDARDLLPLGRHRWAAAALLHRSRRHGPARGDRPARSSADGRHPGGLLAS